MSGLQELAKAAGQLRSVPCALLVLVELFAQARATGNRIGQVSAGMMIGELIKEIGVLSKPISRGSVKNIFACVFQSALMSDQHYGVTRIHAHRAELPV